MARRRSSNKTVINQHKDELQGLALLAIMALPFLLYVAAQNKQGVFVDVLLGLLALIMLGVMFVS